MRRMAPDALHFHCNFYIPLGAGLAGFPKAAGLGVGGQQHVGVQPDNLHTLLAVSAHHKPGNAAL